MIARYFHLQTGGDQPTPLTPFIFDWFLHLFEESDNARVLKTQIASYVCFAGLFFSLLLTVIYGFSGQLIEFYISAASVLILLTSLSLLIFDCFNCGISILVGGVISTTWAGVLLVGGIDDVGIQMIYPIFLLISVMYSWKKGVYFGVISVAMIILILVFESVGYYGEPTPNESPLAKGIVLISIFLIMACSTAFILYKLEQTNRLLAEARNDLERLVSEKDSFLSMLTHDMKSPLTTIGLSADMIERHPEMVAQKPFLIDRLKRSHQALLNLVNDIIDLERMRKLGGLKLNKKRHDLLKSAQDAVDGVMAQARKKQIEVEFVHNLTVDCCSFVEGDPHQLARMMTNLLTNAIKYSPSETRVIVDLQADRSHFHFSVKDQGYGIPENEVHTIFDFYQRAQSNEGKAAGSGIGLAIVKGIVEQHRGEVRVDSVLSKGTEFTVTLPRIVS